MKIEEDTVVFKSEPSNFRAEKRGLKPNTERLLTQSGVGMLLVNENEEHPAFSCNDFKPKRIRVECANPHLCAKGFEPFEHPLTDIRQIGKLCGYYLFVFSWRHEE